MTIQQAKQREVPKEEVPARSDAPPERLVEVDRQRGRFRVHRSAYRSPEVFERERKLIFEKC